MTKNILVHAYGAETEPIKRAIGMVVDFAEQNRECLDVALYVYSLDKLRQATTIANVLGPAFCKALLNRQAVPLTGSGGRATHTQGVWRQTEPSSEVEEQIAAPAIGYIELTEELTTTGAAAISSEPEPTSRLEIAPDEGGDVLLPLPSASRNRSRACGPRAEP